MKKAGVLLFIISVSLYVYSMLIFPWFESNGDWNRVQKVWYFWQSLNVGVLALTSSIIFYFAVQYNEEKQRKRRFVASRAFLPDTLSDMAQYYQDCAIPLVEAYSRTYNKGGQCKTPLASKLPQLPKMYRKVFSNCIN